MKWKERLQADIRLVGIGLLISGVLIWFLYAKIGYWIILAFVVFLALVVFLPPLWYKLVEKIRRYRKTREFEKNLRVELLSALEIMDSVGSSYANEDEANKELVCILRAKGIKTVYQPSEEGTRPDIRIIGENTFIEGKLDIKHKSDADRLVGQIEKYSENRGCSTLAIVIYGQCEEEFKTRFENNLKRFFGERYTLVCLPNPRRFKKAESPPARIEVRRLE